MRAPRWWLIAVALSCGPQSADRTSETIGAGGGMLTGPKGATVVVPSGAVAADVTISAETATSPAAPPNVDTVGDTIILGPEGQQFSVPVEVTLNVDLAKLPAGTSLSDVVIYSAPVGSEAYENLGGAPVGTGQVRATTTHFSKFVPGVRRKNDDDGGTGGGAGGGSAASGGGMAAGGGGTNASGGGTNASGGGTNASGGGTNASGGGSSASGGGSSAAGGGSSATGGGSSATGGGSSATGGGTGATGGGTGATGGGGTGGGTADAGSDAGFVACPMQQFQTSTSCTLIYSSACAGESAQCPKDGGLCTCFRDGGTPSGTYNPGSLNICSLPFQFMQNVQAGCGFP